MTTIARVFVNQIEVGALPSAQYRAAVEQARRDWRLYALQGFNVVGACLRFVIASLRLVPALWFIAAACLAIWEPESITKFVAKLAIISPEELSHGFQQLLLWSTAFTAFSLCLGVAFSGFDKFGYINIFDRAVNKRIREVLEVPAEGDMMICVVEEAGNDSHKQ